MKISIISDLEGVTGMIWGGFGLPPSGELPYYTEVMTAEVNTIVRALQENGVDDIYLYEAHPMQPGILPGNLSRGTDIEEIAGSRCLFFVGQHAAAGETRGASAHTMNSLTTGRIRINGKLAGELTLVAGYAGALGIPTVFVSGDIHTIREARRNLPPLESVADEIGLSNHSAICRPFRSIEPELREKTIRALKSLDSAVPPDFRPVTMEIEKRYPGMAEKIAGMSFTQRTKRNTLVIKAGDMKEAFHLYMAAVMGREFWDQKMREGRT